MTVWRGGAKNKAPYESTHVRVPVPIKLKVEALINEFRASIDGFNKGETQRPKSSLTSSEEAEEEEKDEEEDNAEPSDLEIIKSQAETIRTYASEIHFLKYKLEQVSLLTSLEDAKENAKKILKAKKSASQSVAKLLSSIYQVEITTDDLK
jgi:hypothetical protein